MATRVVCDKCGSVLTRWLRVNVGIEACSSSTNVGDMQVLPREYDLCENCYEKIMNTIRESERRD